MNTSTQQETASDKCQLVIDVWNKAIDEALEIVIDQYNYVFGSPGKFKDSVEILEVLEKAENKIRALRK